MAFSSAIIGGADSANFVKGYPIMAANKHAVMATTAKWNDAGTWTDADLTDADYPITALTDGFLNIGTKPQSALQVWYLVFHHLVVSWPIDYVFLSFNQASLHASTVITLQFCNDEDGIFTPATDEYSLAALWTSSVDRTFCAQLCLAGDPAGAQRRMQTKYWRLKIDAGAGNTNKPVFYEAWFGRQRQLPSPPLYPYASEASLCGGAYGSYCGDFKSDGGLISRYSKGTGGRILRATIPLTSTSEIEQLVAFWRECGYGSKPFIWCQNGYYGVYPSSYPSVNAPILMLADDPGEQLFEQSEYGLSQVEISATEQGGKTIESEWQSAGWF
jgi:hypothetical protein